MTTSPVREAVERLTAHAEFIGKPDAGVVMVAFPRHVVAADLTLVLSALQEAREALGPFAGLMSLSDPQLEGRGNHHVSGLIAPAFLTDRDFRRAAEVYRALSPGGADE